MVPHITNTHLTRLSLKEHEANKIIIDASRVNKKEDFLKMMGLQKIDVHRKIDFLLRNIKVLPCRVVIAGEKCKACKKCFKCRTDLDLHVKQCHQNIIGKNTYSTQYNCYQAKKKRLRLVLKIGNEVLSKMVLKRKYLKLNVQIRNENKNCLNLMKNQQSEEELVLTKYMNQNRLTASQKLNCAILNRESKWPGILQNGGRLLQKRKSTNSGIDARVQENNATVGELSELSIFRQEVANIIRNIDDRIQKDPTSKIQKMDSVEIEKPKTPPSDKIEIILSDDEDIAEIVKFKKPNGSAKTTFANLTNTFADENEEPPLKKTKIFAQDGKENSGKKFKGVMDNCENHPNPQAGVRHFQRSILMADALEEMRKMEEKGFYLRERQAGRKQHVHKIVDLT